VLYLDGPGKTLEDLDAIPVPTARPWDSRGTSHWQPINHGRLARTIIAESEAQGLEIRSQQWETNGTGSDLFGSLSFHRSREHPLPRGLGLSIGVRHSNAGRYAVTLVFGADVFVCSNGMMVGEHPLTRKHTLGLDLNEAVAAGIASYLYELPGIGDFVRRMKKVRLEIRQADHLLAEAGRRKVVPWSQIGKVEQAWREPEHDVFEPRNAWSLYNAFTSVSRRRSARGQLDALRGLGDLFAPGSLEALVG